MVRVDVKEIKERALAAHAPRDPRGRRIYRSAHGSVLWIENERGHLVTLHEDGTEEMFESADTAKRYVAMGHVRFSHWENFIIQEEPF